MAQDTFKIFVEQLRDGHTEVLSGQLSPNFLEVKEEDLRFEDLIEVEGEAYLADNELIVHLNIKTLATLPCVICNQPVKVEEEIKNFYHAEPLENIKSGIYSLQGLIRESIVLDAPSFAECEGRCPQREDIAKYLKDPNKSIDSNSEDGYQPFADLDWDK